MRFRTTLAGILVVLTATLFAQETPSPQFGLGLSIGAQSFPNPAFTGEDGQPELITYQSLGLTPDLALGKFGIGLDLTLNYRFTAGAGDQFEVRPQDWIPDAERNFLEIYLPKLRYVRWGLKGDPLYVLLGTVDNGTLGNGFIMGGYTNTQFLPSRRLFGMSLDVDGTLFGFPYVGVETFAANLAAFDLIGSRLFVRPLIATGIPVMRNLQIGATVVADRDPYYFADSTDTAGDDADPVIVWGTDFRLPILSNPVISLAGFGDYVMQRSNPGGMLGFGGRLFGIVTYGAQLRMLGENFIPVYFDRAYDLFRVEKYTVYTGQNDEPMDPYVGWFATAGFSLLDDQLAFAANIAGPFGGIDPDNKYKQPDLLATFLLDEGILGGFSVEASYRKIGITHLADLLNAEDAVIGARVNYRIQNATISLVYDLKHNPSPLPGQDPWTITSKIESKITLF
ncbi:MAG: hypothetical protein EA382_03850 [Spirochaetaceae bacterium]|nr:MAG: hypothetical protein EA382_03850 [Spirochaetaceae bacterium]